MAKKQAEKPDEAKEKAAAPAEQTAGAEAKKPRAPKAKAPKGEPAPAAAAAEAAPPVTPSTAAPAPAGPTKKKGQQPGNPPRRGKKLLNKLKNDRQRIAKTGAAPLKQAISLLKQIKRAKFDETVEVHMSLGIDTTQSDQMIRGSVPLPHGLGKVKRVVVFCQGDNVAKAKEAGADFAGGDELVEKVQKEGWLDFDVALATQDMMGKVSRLGKVLGPRGLMPTPKAGTVITAGQDVAQAVREQKAGKVEYRADKGGNVHAGIGKISFDDDKLAANITAFVDQVRAAKPAGVKGNYVKSITVAATMTPGIPVTM
ncbi:MAG TPA: 50S ribosomal protein L1 [Gemmataceae bacterium]|nr:50S ribosomal protein L1 [Gemmataceae bacterium]